MVYAEVFFYLVLIQCIDKLVWKREKLLITNVANARTYRAETVNVTFFKPNPAGTPTS